MTQNIPFTIRKVFSERRPPPRQLVAQVTMTLSEMQQTFNQFFFIPLPGYPHNFTKSITIDNVLRNVASRQRNKPTLAETYLLGATGFMNTWQSRMREVRTTTPG